MNGVLQEVRTHTLIISAFNTWYSIKMTAKENRGRKVSTVARLPRLKKLYV